VGALALVHLAFFWRALTLRGAFIHGDLLFFFEPVKGFMHESLRAGRLPLWCPHIMCGYPLAAEGQIAAFHPLSLALSWLLPSPAAIGWLLAVHLLAAGLGAYALARTLGCSPSAAWLSGLVFSLSGYLLSHLHHVSLICAAAWLPVILVFVERAWRGPMARNIALAGLACSMAALAGHPQTLFHITLAVLFWVGWRTVERARRARRWPLRTALIVAAGTLVLGAGLAAVQLLPTAELAAAAPRAGRGDLGYITSFSLRPEHLIGLVAPNWQGTPADDTYSGRPYYWEYVLYLGIAPLALALVGGTQRRAWPLAGLAAAALLLALARNNPLYELLRHLPGFGDFRVPARFIFLFTLAAALLVGYGWETIARLPAVGRGRRAIVLGGAVAAASVLDLWAFGRTLAPLADPRILTTPHPVAELVGEDPDWARVHILPPQRVDAEWVPPGGWATNPDGWAEARRLLPPNVPMSYGLRTLDGYAAFVDRQQAPLFNAAFLDAVLHKDLSLLSLLGAKYLAVGGGTSFPELEGVQAGPFTVYRNPGAFPHVFTAGEVVAAADPIEAYFRTTELARAGRLRDVAVVEGELDGLQLEPGATVSLATEVRRPEWVIAHTEASGPTLVVLNERWDRGWRARVDGRPAPLLKVNGVLMGAVTPAGEHTVEFLYRPTGFLVGRALTLVSAAACAALVLWPRRRRGRPAR